MVVDGNNRDGHGFEIRHTPVGPFVSVLTVSGPIENGAQEQLRASLADCDLASKRAVVDLTEATLYDSWPFPLLVEATQRFEDAGGVLVVVSGDNATVEPFVVEADLGGLHWYGSLDDALMDLLSEAVERTVWEPELPEVR